MWRNSATRVGAIFLVCASALCAFSAPADEYTQKASQRFLYKSISSLDVDRQEDANFIRIDPTCCCNNEIMRIFSDRTQSENARVNPATDYMIASLGEYEKQMRYAVKQVENLKQINAMYSFPNDAYPTSSTYAPDVNYTGEGCEPLDFSNPEDRDKYLAVVDQMENSGRGTDAYSLGNLEGGSAFGRYQIMPSTASTYCQLTTPSLDCCNNWRTTPQCQDEMFELLTRANTQGLINNGIPLNTCTLYIAHQQGAGGLYWLYGGRNPYGDDITKLKNAVFSNLSISERERIIASGIDLNNEENLRNIYNDFWSRKFGENILGSGGQPYSPTDFTLESQKFIDYAEARKHLWREGILLELMQIIHNLKEDDKIWH